MKSRTTFPIRVTHRRFGMAIVFTLMLLAWICHAPAIVHAQTTQSAAATQPATQPTTRPAALDPLHNLPSYGAMVRRTAYTLFGIIAGVIILAKLLQRWTGVVRRPLSRNRLIEVIEYHRLEPRKGIYLVRVAGNYFLIGSTQDRLETLSGGPLDAGTIAAALAPPTKTSSASSQKTSSSPARTFLEVLRGKRNDMGE